MTVLEQLRKTIEDGHPGETEKLVREALKQHIPAGRIVEEAMTPAMRTVGENYKSNGADIIKILAAARSVRKGFELLEEQDSQFGRRNIGTVILGTVEGDLHDVGKNLVAIMFRSAGFKVILMKWVNTGKDSGKISEALFPIISDLGKKHRSK